VIVFMTRWRGGPALDPERSDRIRSAGRFVAESVVSSTADEVVSVSAVIPTYQSRATVLEATRSALAQQGAGSHEVIVVDDGSTDGTGVALKQLAAETAGRLHYLRLDRNRGRATARNVGVAAARGGIVAFMDADCLATPGWLAAAERELADPRVGIVQGPTRPCPGQARPFFNHFIEIERFDGTFSTCNVFYRRDALLAVDGFDPRVVYWEDLDLGWRVRRAGWEAAFAPKALVYHQVLPLSPLRWLRWPLHYRYLPAKTARYPEYRRFLFLGVWASWFHLAAELALLSVLLGWLVNRRWLALGLPYLAAFPFRHGLGGRWPLVKAMCHIVWDAGSCGVLLISSLR
ncbi:MAG: glycosyltransferase family 2 protein, partial [Solirubrobacteraceae bacterium]